MSIDSYNWRSGIRPRQFKCWHALRGSLVLFGAGCWVALASSGRALDVLKGD